MAIKKRKRSFGVSRSATGVQDSGLRPKNVEKMPPCTDACPSGNLIRQILTTIAQTEKKGRTWEQSYEKAWYLFMERNPFPSVCSPLKTKLNSQVLLQ